MGRRRDWSQARGIRARSLLQHREAFPPFCSCFWFASFPKSENGRTYTQTTFAHPWPSNFSSIPVLWSVRSDVPIFLHFGEKKGTDHDYQTSHLTLMLIIKLRFLTSPTMLQHSFWGNIWIARCLQLACNLLSDRLPAADSLVKHVCASVFLPIKDTARRFWMWRNLQTQAFTLREHHGEDHHVDIF